MHPKMKAASILVAAQLSSFVPCSNAPSIALQSSRPNAPTASQIDADVYQEHASSASIFHTSQTGSILLRVVHDGSIVELISLSTSVPPIRFVFPAPVLLKPGIYALGEQELHLLAVTITGSLYRLVLPTTNPTQLWHDQVARNWCREYTIQNVLDVTGGVVHVQSLHCVAIGLGNGSLLRIDAERIGDNSSDGVSTFATGQQTVYLIHNLQISGQRRSTNQGHSLARSHHIFQGFTPQRTQPLKFSVWPAFLSPPRSVKYGHLHETAHFVCGP